MHGNGSIYCLLKRVKLDRTEELLLIRAEDIDRRPAQTVQEYLRIDVSNIITSNVSDEDGFSEIYRHFKSTVAPPRELLERK